MTEIPKAKVHCMEEAQRKFEEKREGERIVRVEYVANCNDEFAPEYWGKRVHQATTVNKVSENNPNVIRIGFTMQISTDFSKLKKYPWLKNAPREEWQERIARHEKLVADLLMMLEAGRVSIEADIRDHIGWEHPKKKKDEKNHMVDGKPLSTTIPMYSSLPCPGLGPSRVEDLGLVK